MINKHLCRDDASDGDAASDALIWLAGSNQLPDNELLRRFANALHAVGAPRLTIHGAVAGANVDRVFAAAAARSRRVFMGGHSKGGGKALARCHGAADRVGVIAGAIVINPASDPGPGPIPSLAIIGESDGGGKMLPRDWEWPHDQHLQAAAPAVAGGGAAERLRLVARCGDHSIRWCPDHGMDKETASASPETAAMNLAVAKAVVDFMGRCTGRGGEEGS